MVNKPRDSENCSAQELARGGKDTGGEGGIRTRGRGINPFNSLANCRFRPLSHLSNADLVGPQGFEPRTNGL